MISRAGDWLSANVGEELIMMSAEKGTYIGLTHVGARIWEMIESPLSVEEVCRQLVREFDVAADVCRAEVEAFLNELVTHGAATLRPSRAA